MTTEEILALAEAAGFSHFGALNMAALQFLPEVREMCAAGRCHSYGKNWCCPPGCGSLEDASAKAARYHRGVLVQTTGQLEDDFDVEAMLETEKQHKKRFYAFVQKLRERYPQCLPMAAGACTVCPSCTYPAAPCRHPDLAIPSMEAYGLFVSQVCADSGLGYYYGPRTISYSSCVLVD